MVLVSTRHLYVAWEFKLQDAWIGAFWSHWTQTKALHIWVCLVPCFPIHFVVGRDE